MEEKEKMKKVVVEERLDHRAEGDNDHCNVPPKELCGNGAKESHCHCCPVHTPPKPQLKTMPCGHKKGGRNLIVCIDGTANQFGKKNTNVIELYNLILKGTNNDQCTWYNSGIGTYARPHWASFQYACQVLWHMIDLGIAWNFDKTVQGAYRWLSDNYQEGDCIFLFGFSRGAFQVRALSGMIEKVGLIHKGNEMQIPFAYELYADPESDKEQAAPVGSMTTDGERVSMAKRFKQAFSRPGVKVHFVGAWDTVSSIGIARGKRVLPLTTEGMTHVCYFRHALALDERRVKFLPEYAWGGTTLPPEPGLAGVSHHDRARPHILEVWFPGTHSDIGGGNANNDGMDRSRPPMRWMASQAAELGLRIGVFKRELQSSEQIEFQESLTGFWHLFELLPFRRLSFSRTFINSVTRIPHLWSGRKIHEGQKIHYSFIEGETTSPYIPKAYPKGDRASFWTDLRSEALRGPVQLLERDVFYRAADAVNKVLAGDDARELLAELVADSMLTLVLPAD
ncbi:hypothetical protein EST38_g9576 [Candolleomyces aberdarensis]|uniref:T6SS Phospholipase effector Tle1-like catalytic domain-containing protein n=1 Tax=Candolleomyces aberdarensis TaxID=2316362 RepID=A0A4Q2DBR9_9AGAR|nr:hypothetical protein EST38_g9576 [Candolleomyces aberdarensis]